MKDKLDQIKDVLTDQKTTLETKLAAIEAAVKAQTLSLEGKLGLLEAAVKALPDYSSQLEAISTAIDNLPDYGEKLSAIVASLNEIKDQAEALGTGQTSIAASTRRGCTWPTSGRSEGRGPHIPSWKGSCRLRRCCP